MKIEQIDRFRCGCEVHLCVSDAGESGRTVVEALVLCVEHLFLTEGRDDHAVWLWLRETVGRPR